jgi:hypothetical protein
MGFSSGPSSTQSPGGLDRPPMPMPQGNTGFPTSPNPQQQLLSSLLQAYGGGNPWMTSGMGGAIGGGLPGLPTQMGPSITGQSPEGLDRPPMRMPTTPYATQTIGQPGPAYLGQQPTPTAPTPFPVNTRESGLQR